MMGAPLLQRARAEAEQVLLANGGELGLLGSRSAYQQVWARDSMICGLGLLLCADSEGGAIHRRSLETLRRFQSPLGSVAHNVGFAGVADPALIAHGGVTGGVDGPMQDVLLGADGADASDPSRWNPAPSRGGENSSVPVRDTIHAGCVDGNLWYIIGHYYNYAAGGDRALLEGAWESLERALLWLRYQDSNECGLLEVHEAMDWADLFVNRYNVLYDNVLYFAAWTCMAAMADALALPSDVYRRNAEDVRRKVNAVLWVGPEEPRDWEWIGSTRREWLYTLRRIETELVERPFYLPYVAFRDYADRLDTLGNLLAIVFGLADGCKAGKILDYIQGCGLNRPYPVRALYPVINPGDRGWREYYRVRNLNLPHHYHNGGAWPFIGGFYVAALVQAGRVEEARKQLARLAAMNRRGRTREWGFNEWFHGLSGEPMGYDGQSWSAALFIFAQDCVQRERIPVFNRQHGWGSDRVPHAERGNPGCRSLEGE